MYSTIGVSLGESENSSLYFGTVNPTVTGQEVDNDSYIVVAGRDLGHYGKRFFKRICEVVCRDPSGCIRVRGLPSWAKMIDGVQS